MPKDKCITVVAKTLKGGNSVAMNSMRPSVTSDAGIDVVIGTLEQDTMDKSWYEVLKAEFEKAYFKKVSTRVFFYCLPCSALAKGIPHRGTQIAHSLPSL